MKKMFFHFLFLFVFQSISSITLIELKNSDNHIFGVGEHVRFEKADKRALADLSSQISIKVEASFEDYYQDKDGNLSEYSEKIINTYSKSILENAHRIIEEIEGENKFKVYRYISIKEKEKIFIGRQNKVFEYTKNGIDKENINDIGNSLRCYYWALLLLKTLPNKNMITYDSDDGDRILITFLTEKIVSILSTVAFEIGNIEYKSDKAILYLTSSYNQKSITNLNYSYFDGNNWYKANIKDGKGVMYILSDYYDNIHDININLEYEYSDYLRGAALDEDVKMIADLFFVNFNNKYLLVKRNIKSIKKDPINYLSNDNIYKNIVNNVIESIETKNFHIIKKHFTKQGYEQFLKIMNYGEVNNYKGDYSIEFLQYGDQIQIRSIPLIFFLDDNSNKIVYDNIVLIIENDKIEWVNFAIANNTFIEESRRGKISGDMTKRILGVNFMEYYKTIFSLKDIAKIEEIFADSVLIFTGYVKDKEANNPSLQDAIGMQMSNKEINFKKSTKEQYIERLQNIIFKVNKFVNIQFSELEIIRRSKELPIYGIQLNQNYYSSNYSDEGYLLLLVDFYDEENPKIFFRYWHPKKQDISNAKQLSVGDFRF